MAAAPIQHRRDMGEFDYGRVDQLSPLVRRVICKNPNPFTYKGTATLFNLAHIQGTPPHKKKFPTVGDVVKFKCDVHPWMTGYLLVTDKPKPPPTVRVGVGNAPGGGKIDVRVAF